MFFWNGHRVLFIVSLDRSSFEATTDASDKLPEMGKLYNIL